jgi:hypothetical protein
MHGSGYSATSASTSPRECFGRPEERDVGGSNAHASNAWALVPGGPLKQRERRHLVHSWPAIDTFGC